MTRSTVNCVLLSALAGALRRFLQGCGVKHPPDIKVGERSPNYLPKRRETLAVRRRFSRWTSGTRPPRGDSARDWATNPHPCSFPCRSRSRVACRDSGPPERPSTLFGTRPTPSFSTWQRRLSCPSVPHPSPEISWTPSRTKPAFSFRPCRVPRRKFTSEVRSAIYSGRDLPHPSRAKLAKSALRLVPGQTLKAIYPLLPAQAKLGISITAITYADQVFVSVIAERALGPAAELILEYLEDQIEVLWNLLLHRRVPGEVRKSTTYTPFDASGSSADDVGVCCS